MAEYVLYDPTAEYLDPPVRGCRLDQGHYADMPRDADGRMISDQLGLKLTLVDGLLEFFEPRTGARLLDRVEGRMQAEIETQHEARLRARAEARAEMEAARAEMEAARTDAEAEARRALETRVAEQAPPGN